MNDISKNLKIEIIDPRDYSGWDELVISSGHCSFFHSAGWTRVLSESYGYNPLYFTIIENGKLSALVPVMEIKSFLTGHRGVCLPFSDYCEPVIIGNHRFQDMFQFIIDYAKKAGWKTIEFRGGSNLFSDSPALTEYLMHTVDLSRNEDEIFRGLRSSTKRNVKKAVKEGVEVEISSSFDSIKEFYRLNCVTRKKHGLPPQPYNFFMKIYEHIIVESQGFVVSASYKGKIIACAVCFHYGGAALYKYGASDIQFQHLRPNNLVMWAAIKWFLKNGYKSLSLGRTRAENKGLRQFKNGWSAAETVIKYYKYDLAKQMYVSHCPEVRSFYNKLFGKMPVPLLKITGRLLYKHVG